MDFFLSRLLFVALKARTVLAIIVALMSSFAADAAEWKFEFGAGVFDPANPDEPEKVHIPASPSGRAAPKTCGS